MTSASGITRIAMQILCQSVTQRECGGAEWGRGGEERREGWGGSKYGHYSLLCMPLGVMTDSFAGTALGRLGGPRNRE